jgi:hypothetical protein
MNIYTIFNIYARSVTNAYCAANPLVFSYIIKIIGYCNRNKTMREHSDRFPILGIGTKGIDPALIGKE